MSPLNPPRCAICTQAYGDGTHTPDEVILAAWWAWHRSKEHREAPR